jgi:ribosomal-protein-alanine N-acetyltransferase
MSAQAAEIPLCFEPLRPEHLQAVLAIEVEAFPESWTRGMFLEEIKNERSHFFAATRDDTLVGYGGFWLILDEAHITSVAIRHDCRGRGLGSRVVDYLLSEARAVGAVMATLEVRVSNLRARDLYLRKGFRPVGMRKGYYSTNNEDAIVMLKEFGEQRP